MQMMNFFVLWPGSLYFMKSITRTLLSLLLSRRDLYDMIFTMHRVFFNTIVNKLRTIVLVFAFVLTILPTLVYASGSTTPPARLSMTLTPPLYQLSLAPGATWSSNLKFVNDNRYDLVVYASAQDFRTSKESGITFTPVHVATNTLAYELASWIELPKGPITVTRGATIDIPFTIAIPDNASPGGHYAAILVGNAPGGENAGAMSVGSQISSLLLLRVTGDIIEQGGIQDFLVAENIVQTQEELFTLNFANTGNVHIVPKGDIVITNMFGRERGRIVVDEENILGNVLPETTRTFTFEWRGKQNFFDIGRYTARVALTFGEEGTRNVYSTAHFWVIPWIPLLVISCALLLFFLFMRFGLRRYVARAILLEQEKQGITHSTKKKEGSVVVTFEMLREPVMEGIRNFSLHDHEHITREGGAKRLPLQHLYKKYYLFILWIVVFILWVLLIGYYFHQVFEEERSYRMIIKKDGTHNVVTSGNALRDMAPAKQ